MVFAPKFINKCTEDGFTLHINVLLSFLKSVYYFKLHTQLCLKTVTVNISNIAIKNFTHLLYFPTLTSRTDKNRCSRHLERENCQISTSAPKYLHMYEATHIYSYYFFLSKLIIITEGENLDSAKIK
jgi:hypothetical protein